MQTEASQITAFLRQRKILTRIVGGFAAPAYYVYVLEMAPQERFDRLAAALDDLQRVLYSARVHHRQIDEADPRARVTVRASMQPLVLEVSRPQPATLELTTIDWRPAPFVALAGVSYVTKTGQAITWNLLDPGQPHLLIAGMSGSGKSNLELSLALTLCRSTPPDKLTLYVVDGGNSTLQLLEKLAHCARFAGDADGAQSIIAHVVAIVMDRKKRSETNPQHRVVLIVDELANLLAVMDKQAAVQLQRDLATIAAEGRKFGVHLVACTQKPLSEVTGSLTKSNMAVRMVGLVANWQDAQTAADMAGTGAERLAGRGDFIYRNGQIVQRFQAPMVAVVGAIKAVNRAWCDVNPTEARTALAPQQVSDDAPRGIPVGTPPALLPVFAQFTQPDGTLRRGAMAAALRTLYGDEAPQSGKRYQMEYDKVMTWHAAYFTSLHRPDGTPAQVVAIGAAPGSEVKVWM
jgi:hypothetical protein